MNIIKQTYIKYINIISIMEKKFFLIHIKIIKLNKKIFYTCNITNQCKKSIADKKIEFYYSIT